MATLKEKLDQIESVIETLESDPLDLEVSIQRYKSLLTLSKDVFSTLSTLQKDIHILTEEGQSLLQDHDRDNANPS